MFNLGAGETIQGVAGAATRITYTITGMELTAATNSEAYKVLAQGQLPIVAAPIYTVGVGISAFIKSMAFLNTGAATTVTIYINGSADANKVFSINLGTGYSLVFDQNGWQVYDETGGQSFKGVWGLHAVTHEEGGGDVVYVTGSMIGDGEIKNRMLAASAVTATKIAVSAVTASKIGVSAVTTSKIAASAVTTPKIKAGNVMATSLGTSAVTTAKIASLAVTTGKIGASAVTATKIAVSAVTTAKIAASAITAAKLIASALDYIKYHGQDSRLLNASGRASFATTGFIPEGVFVVPWTASFIFIRLGTKPTTSKVTLEFGLRKSMSLVVNASTRTVSFYYEYMRP